MLPVKKETENIIKGNNRIYTAEVIFNFLSCKIPQAIKICAPNAQSGSVPDQIVFPYLSHLSDRAFTRSPVRNKVFPKPQNIHKDGALHQVQKRPYPHVGYIGERARADGSVNDTVTLYIPRTDLKKITLRTNYDRIIQNAVITAKDITGKELARFTLSGNTQSELIFDLPCKRAGIIEISITKHTPNKRIWVLSFYPGFEWKVDETSIIKIKHQKKKTENKEGSVGRLYINSLSLTLSNIERIYDERNATSPVAGYFNSNAVVSAGIKLKNPNGTQPLALNFGTFFVTEIKTDENTAQVAIKAQDYIGLNKNTYLALGIQEESDAHACFSKIAQALNLSSVLVASELKQIKLSRLPLSGSAGSLLNKLCVLTNAFCSCDISGSKLIAVPMLSRHGAVRYPCRYFFTDEYKGELGGKASAQSPNVINLSYTTYEYEGEYQVGRKIPYLYASIGKLSFPDRYKNTPYGDYPIGGGLNPSVQFTIELPDTFQTIEFSDPLIPKVLEYDVSYEYSSQGKPLTAAVKIWNFIERTEGEQITVAVMIRAKPISILLKKEEFTVPKRPHSYVTPPLDPSLNQSDSIEVLNRNARNTPFEFKVGIKDAVNISRVEIANRFIQSKFEFTYEKTAEGITVKAWNYLPESPQTVTVNIYGNRLKAGSEKKTITARNAEDVQRNGEIVKNMEVGSLASDETARQVLNAMAYYYRTFSKDLSVQVWADPRITLYDLIAFKSLRGYGFVQGIIDELELEYAGFLTQKLKIKETKKHSRDSRLFGSAVLSDRPVIVQSFLGYA